MALDLPITPRSHYRGDINDCVENALVLPRIVHPYKKYAAEVVGTFMFIFIALATVNQTVLSSNIPSQLIIAFGFGIGLAVGVQIAGNISGAHLNPAVSLTMWVTGSLPGVDLFWYIVGQLFGSFCAAALVFLLYYNSIDILPYDASSASMFGTLKNENTSIFIGLIEQVVGTALLMLGVLRVLKINKYVPVLIGLVLFTLAICLGNNGFAFNPARDLGPRLFTLIFWGFDVFKYQDYWFWVPIVGPCIGALLGFFVNELFEKLDI